jgi:PAS domain S-box-containing protein
MMIETTSMPVLEAERACAAARPPDTLGKIQDAFRLFQSQSEQLQTAYDGLKRDLAVTHRRLREKNESLSAKVGELRRMSSRLECIVASLTDGVLVVDRELNVDLCNPVMARLIGLSPQAPTRGPYRDMTNGLGDAALLESVLRTGRPVLDRERSGVGRDGREVVVLASAAPILDPNRQILGAVEVMRDVTEIRRLEERVQNQKRMAALGEMAASVAHEIRNPLGTIEGFARLLKRDLADQPDRLRLAGKIVEGVQNLNYVITNMLTYARPMSLQCEPFAVAALLADVEPILQDRARNERVALSVDRDGLDDLVMDGDIRQWRQVLLNLGMNAIEACMEKFRRTGAVRTRSQTPLGQVTLSAERRGSRVALTVRDNGCGIAAADRARLFDPFFTKKHGGTGLGLSLCHKIVTAHGGEIGLESREGRGSLFLILAPGARADTQDAAA